MQGRTSTLAGLATLVLALITSGFAYATETIKYRRGDVDGDGQITLKDAQLGIDFHFGLSSVDVLEALDVNDDGRFDADDVSLIAAVIYFNKAVPNLGLDESATFLRGDVDDDGVLSDADVVLLKAYLDPFQAAPVARVLDAADVNDDGLLDREDVEVLRKTIGAQEEDNAVEGDKGAEKGVTSQQSTALPKSGKGGASAGGSGPDNTMPNLNPKAKATPTKGSNPGTGGANPGSNPAAGSNPAPGKGGSGGSNPAPGKGSNPAPGKGGKGGPNPAGGSNPASNPGNKIDNSKPHPICPSTGLPCPHGIIPPFKTA